MSFRTEISWIYQKGGAEQRRQKGFLDVLIRNPGKSEKLDGAHIVSKLVRSMEKTV